MMYNDNELELTLEERSLLASLPREMPAGDLLEAKVVRAMKENGHFGGAERVTGTNRIPTAVRIAAAIALFAGGVATGRYILAAESPRASATAPARYDRAADSTPRTETRPVQRNETVVAEREMWL